MSAGFSRIQAVSNARLIEIRLAIENRSDDTWRKRDGFCVGWQLFDPAGPAFLLEGHWQEVADELRPGEECVTALTIELPDEDGHYHLYVSPRTGEGWHYQLHWPFVLLEAAVQDGSANIERYEVTTLGRLRRRSLGPRLWRALVRPAETLWQHRSLINSMARRDLAAHYRGSLGDAAWTVLHPLLLMVTYFFVFGIVLRARFGADPSRAGFVLYFLAGMLPWLPFSDAVGRAPTVILEHRNLVKKLLFPVDILPVSRAVAALATEGFALLIFVVLLLAARGGVPVTVLWIPLLVIPQFLLTVAACWFLAALGVYLRDLGQVIGFLLTLAFFLSPICYPESALPAEALVILEKSPIFALVRGYRAVLLESRAPDLMSLGLLWIGSGSACVLAHAWFTRLKRSFSDLM
jgi:lipopolysaccharide transport system permease protein